mgnify:CR=1 FL=1
MPDESERAALIHYVKAGHNENAPIRKTEKWGKLAREAKVTID